MAFLDHSGKPDRSAGWDRPHVCAAALLCLLGIAMRLYGAWCFALSPSSDHNIVSLMAKHIGEGKPIPVFYYGQPWMGSLEAVVSGVFCALFGASGFTVNLGPVFFGSLLLPVVYLWGRGAAGRRGGLAALALCVVGPEHYFQFMSWSFGGYAVNVLASAVVMVLAAWIADREHGDRPTGYGAFFLLGLATGVGWWTNQLILAAAAGAALLLLVSLRLRVLRPRLFAGVGGFVLGSMPFWVWNIRHDWGTFRMLARTSHQSQLMRSLRLLAGRHMFDMLQLTLSRWTAVPLVLLALIFIVLTVHSLLKHGLRGVAIYRLACVFLIMATLLGFSRSGNPRYVNPRYLLAILPAIAVMLGTVTSSASGRVRPLVAALPLVAIVFWHASSLPRYATVRRAHHVQYLGRARTLAAFLRDTGIHALFVPYPRIHALNFLLDEEFVFSDNKENILPNAVSLELAESTVVMNDNFGFGRFIAHAGGSASVTNIAGFTVHHDVASPSREMREIPPTSLTILDAGSAPIGEVLGDGNADTAWICPQDRSGTGQVTVRLGSCQAVCGVRLLCRHGEYPRSIEIEARADADADWETIGTVRPTGYFWSGPRVYWGEPYYRLVCRFAPRDAEAIRITCVNPARRPWCTPTELQVFGPGPPAGDVSADLPQLLEFLDERGVEAVYCDRWLANRIHELTQGHMLTPLAHSLRADGRPSLDPMIALKRNMVFVVRERDAPLCGRVLKSAALLFQRARVGPWIVFDCRSEGQGSVQWGAPPLLWAGFAPLRREMPDNCLNEYMARRAAELLGAGHEDEGRRCLSLAGANGGYLSRRAMQYLGEASRLAGEEEQARHWERLVEEAWRPELACDVAFEQGIRFLGLSLSPRQVRPGDTCLITYFWQLPAAADPSGLVTFVHFRSGGETIFQDDHHLLAGIDATCDDVSLYREQRELRVPASAVSAAIDVRLGLYRPYGTRLQRFAARLRRQRQTAIFPEALIVLNPSSATGASGRPDNLTETPGE